MSVVREMRNQAKKPGPELSSGLVMTLGVVAAFAAGGSAVFAWRSYIAPSVRTLVAEGGSSPSQEKAAAAGKQIVWSADRLGNPEESALLRRCVEAGALGQPIDLGAFGGAVLYRMIKIGGFGFGVSGRDATDENAGLVRQVVIYSKLANCVYKEPAKALCDPANRALAVDFTIGLVRGATEVNMTVARDTRGRQDRDLIFDGRQAALVALRERARAGYLVAADFGDKPPASLRDTLGEIKPPADPC